MKTKLLKRLRRRGRNSIWINSKTTIGDEVTGLGYGYSSDNYAGLGCLDEKLLFRRAERVAIKLYLDEKYKKHK